MEVIDPRLLTVIAVVCFASAAFVLLRRFLDRRVTLHKPASDASTPGLPERVDGVFESLVHGTGLPFSASQMIGYFGLSALAMTTLLYFWRDELWAAALGLVLGLILPMLILLIFRKRRRRQIQALLPDAFYFMARSLRAGVSLEQTLSRAAEQMDDPLAVEFRLCAGQIVLGVHPQAALQDTAMRVGLLDFNVFVSTIALYYESGGNLALMLDRLAAAARDRNQFIGYFRAATAMGRAAAIFLGAAVPAIVAVYAIWQPAYAGELFHSAVGWQILGIAAVLEVIGIVWFMYLLRVDY